MFGVHHKYLTDKAYSKKSEIFIEIHICSLIGSPLIFDRFIRHFFAAGRGQYHGVPISYFDSTIGCS